MIVSYSQPHPSEFIRHRPQLPKSMTDALQATLNDLKILVINIDKALGHSQHDKRDIEHMKQWRSELLSQIQDLEK